MPNYYLSVLYKHIIQVENKNVGLKVGGGGTNIPLPPQSKKCGGGHMPPLPPASYASELYIFRGGGGARRYLRFIAKGTGSGTAGTIF